LLVVSHRFHLKPLLALLGSDQRFFVLALSQNRVRLLEGCRERLHDTDVSGMPADMDSALNYTSVDRGEQVHSGAPVGHGKQAAVFHGQGGRADTHKEDLTHFFRQVDAAVYPALRGERAPLLLACVDSHVPLYRAVNSYPYLLDEHISGNFDHVSNSELHARAWPLVEPLLDQARQDCQQKFARVSDHGQGSSDLRAVLPAVWQGRVEALFVDRATQRWGKFDDVQGRLAIHECFERGDDDLLDLAATETLLHGGKVFLVPREQMPAPDSVAAVYRY
jgi:hypothetical protein